ncbi:MAG: type IX secretion system outer membrane channel protein PorV [Bacteroidia bacterium]
MTNQINRLIFILLIFICLNQIKAQVTVRGTGLDGKQNAITTAVPFLLISPDARAASLGDAGAALPNDVNAIHWNIAKSSFNDRKGAISISYTPWLRQLVPDINLSYLTGYYQYDNRSTFSGSLRYFSLGQINFTDNFGNSTGNYTPNELALDFGYSNKLSEHFALGIAFRYIRSDLAGGFNQTQTPVKAGNAFAGDIGMYYKNNGRLRYEGKKYNLDYGIGAAITNIGSKISYTSQQFQNFIPVNLRLGTYANVEIDQYNSIALMVDFNKLLVPSNPQYVLNARGFDSISPATGQRIIQKGYNPDVPVVQGMLQSFYDAPRGFKEELEEINISGGLEYWYDKQFALRGGYFYEHPNKGNRKFFTMGVGIRFNVFGLDVSYLQPIAQRHPLERTLRFTLTFDLDAFASQKEKEDKANIAR